MDEHTDLSGMQAEGCGGGRVFHAIDHLHLDEVIACAHGAALIAAAGERPVAHEFRSRVGDAALGLGQGDVVVGGEPAGFQKRHALLHQHAEFGWGENMATPPPHSYGHIPQQLVDEPHEHRLDIGETKIRSHEADAAVDVVAHATGRDDAAARGVGSADAADAEAVAPVDVGHGEAGGLDTGQERDVGHLLGRPIASQLRHEPLVGENQPVAVICRRSAWPPSLCEDFIHGSGASEECAAAACV